MKKEYIPFVEELIELAIREDIGDGDHTSLATIPADARGKMQLLVKQDGIIAGIEVARMVFDRLDGSVAFDQRIEDGACVRRGDIAFYVEGRILSLLQAERIVLNIMQRMSGVATQTAAYVKLLEGTVEGLQTSHITDEDYAAGWRLSCASKVSSDVTVMVPDLMQPTEEITRLYDRKCDDLLQVRDLLIEGKL